MTPLRVGILSFAHYHANFWAEAFCGDQRTVLAGIWDDDAERGMTEAARFATVYEPSLEALLSRLDAVAITSETANHPMLIEAACARRLPILCEKPLAATMTEARAIADAVAASGVLFAQSFPKRLDPASLALREIVRSGELGRIWLVRIRHGHDHGLDPAFVRGWWTDSALSGGGTWIDEGIHAADFLLWLFGRPSRVQATVGSAALQLAVEDAAVAAFVWDDGLIGEVATGWAFRAASDSVEVYGTVGTALLTGVDLASRQSAGNGPFLRVALGDAPGWADLGVVPSFVAGGFHQRSATAFVDRLCGETVEMAGLGDGIAALELVSAAYRAARSGCAVTI